MIAVFASLLGGKLSGVRTTTAITRRIRPAEVSAWATSITFSNPGRFRSLGWTQYPFGGDVPAQATDVQERYSQGLEFELTANITRKLAGDFQLR